jgi:hypothetical protein
VAQPGWGWEALNGIIALVLGGLIVAEWPASGLGSSAYLSEWI